MELIFVHDSLRPGTWLLQKGEGKETGNRSISEWSACSRKTSVDMPINSFSLEGCPSPNFLKKTEGLDLGKTMTKDHGQKLGVYKKK